MTEHLHLGLNPVRADRAEDFERFLAEIVTPAVRAQRPDLDGRWRVLRSTAPSDGVVTYAFMLEGGTLAEDWELGVRLPAHYAEEEADRLIQGWVETCGERVDRLGLLHRHRPPASAASTSG